jgi:hypothetical protein
MLPHAPDYGRDGRLTTHACHGITHDEARAPAHAHAQRVTDEKAVPPLLSKLLSPRHNLSSCRMRAPQGQGVSVALRRLSCSCPVPVAHGPTALALSCSWSPREAPRLAYGFWTPLAHIMAIVMTAHAIRRRPAWHSPASLDGPPHLCVNQKPASAKLMHAHAPA